MNMAGGRPPCSIGDLPDKVLLRVFSYLSHQQMMKNSVVCKKWRMIAQDSRLWGFVSLRPEISGLCIQNQDFSHGAQLADFSELNDFPTKIKYLCLCLSELDISKAFSENFRFYFYNFQTIFLDNFMKKIYNFINGTEMLHLYGTYEQGEEEEGEVYEVLNIRALKQATPNLRVINMYGVSFVDDSHIEAFSSNCIQLSVLCVNYCSKIRGASLKILIQRCKFLRCLMLQQTNLTDENVMAVEWDKAQNLRELDITATDLSKDCLVDVLTRIPQLTWLSAGQLDGMCDFVLAKWIESGKVATLRSLDVDASDNLTEETLIKFVERFGEQLEGLGCSGMAHVTDTFWNTVLHKMINAKILVMGTSENITTKIHVDHMIDGLSKYCTQLERIEFRWDNETLRFSDKNQKAIDLLRTKCLSLKALVLCDGKLYEIMKGNFERADRRSVIRTSVNSRVTCHYLLQDFDQLLFN